ncbi:PAS domain S-box protein [Candidatus Bipolaricaulota bacterium]|nr:PAS domain S-box protein [Candidatus Bipolaricaulota bacterium]
MNESTNTKKILSSLIEAAPLAVFDLDPEGRVKSIWNDAAKEMFGWKREEVIGNRLPLVPENKTEEFEELLNRVLAGDSFSGVEVKRERKDGSKIDVSISTAPLKDDEGRVKRIMSFVEEITLKKQLERSLKDSERKFREIFNHANDAIYLHELTDEGLPGRFVEVNEVASETLGYSKEEFLSMSPKELDAEEESEKVPEVMEKLSSEGQTTFEMTHRAKDGTKVPVEISSRILELEGEKLALSIARDISDRRRAERQLKESRGRLEAAMEAGNLAWWRIELPSGEATFSDLKAEMLGYSPERFEHYTDFTNLIHPEDKERAMEAMRFHLEGKEKRYEVEYRIRKKNGFYKWFRDVGSLTSFEDDYKEVTGVVIDIDRRKKAELRLEDQRTKLKELHDAVDRFQQCEKEKNLCNVAVQVTERVLDFDLCTFYCVEDDNLVPVAATEGMEADKLTPQKLDEGLAGESFQTKRSILGDDLREEERASTHRTDLRAYMSIPIGEVGVFQAASRQVGSFNKTDLELGEILAGHLHEEIKRIRLEEELRQQAIRDPLTNLYNRRYFNETLKKEAHQVKRYSKPLAFLMIDVNKFKEINDRYSHQTGDKILKEVAKLLKQNVRSADTVVRYGGDEFLIMMPETNGGVTNILDRLNEELDRWNQQSELLDFSLTLAMGVSHWSPRQNRDVEEALNEADRRMYEDKGK